MKLSAELVKEVKKPASKKDTPKETKDMVKNAVVNKVALPDHVVTLLKWSYTLGVKDAREQIAKQAQEQNTGIKTGESNMNQKVTVEDMAKLYAHVDRLERQVYERKYNTVSIEKMDKSQLLETVLNYDRTQADRELAGDILLTKHCNGDTTLFASLLKSAANIRNTGE